MGIWGKWGMGGHNVSPRSSMIMRGTHDEARRGSAISPVPYKPPTETTSKIYLEIHRRLYEIAGINAGPKSHLDKDLHFISSYKYIKLMDDYAIPLLLFWDWLEEGQNEDRTFKELVTWIQKNNKLTEE